MSRKDSLLYQTKGIYPSWTSWYIVRFTGRIGKASDGYYAYQPPYWTYSNNRKLYIYLIQITDRFFHSFLFKQDLKHKRLYDLDMAFRYTAELVCKNNSYTVNQEFTDLYNNVIVKTYNKYIAPEYRVAPLDWDQEEFWKLLEADGWKEHPSSKTSWKNAHMYKEGVDVMLHYDTSTYIEVTSQSTGKRIDEGWEWEIVKRYRDYT